MLHDSELLEKLEVNMPGDSNGVVYAMYGDLAYAQVSIYLGGFRNHLQDLTRHCLTDR